MKFRFKPEDFEILLWGGVYPHTARTIAEASNQLLDKYVATLPEVHGGEDTRFGLDGMTWGAGMDPSDTHRARLWGVEEIKPKQCKHGSVIPMLNPSDLGVRGMCQSCGKRLVAKWEEEE